MKYRSIIFLIVSCMTIGSMAAQGQQDKEAKSSLDRLAKTYEKANSVSMELAIEINYPDRPVERQKANVAQAGSKFFYKADNQEVYCDGSAVWYYLKERNEVQINDYEGAEDEGAMTPMGVLQQYRSGEFEYGITKEVAGVISIELIPKDEYSEYAKYRLNITKSKNELQSVEMIGKDGSKVEIKVEAISLKRTYSNEAFGFDTEAHPNVTIEDLRM